MGRILALAGVNGAGKSSLLGTWLDAEGLSWFNPDSFTRRLVDAGWPLPDANAEAWQEGTRRLRQAMADGTDFAFETTLGGNTIPRLLREACERHQVAIWFCGLADVGLHVARVAARVAAGGVVPLPVLAMAAGQLHYPVAVADLLHTPGWAKPIVMRAMELDTPGD